MSEIGKRLVDQKIITNEQLELALKRQRTHGGKLGINLMSLGLINEADLERIFHKTPPPPQTFTETGLKYIMIEELILKHMFFAGDFKLQDIAFRVKLPAFLVEQVFEILRKDHMMEVKGAPSYSTMTYDYRLTDLGRRRAAELLELCRYVGPLPVSLDAYAEMMELQTIRSIVVREEQVKRAFSHLVLSETKIRQLGPAVSSGQAVFIYGPPGNGKTAIAEAFSSLLEESVYMPYAVTVGDQIINVYDPVTHVPIDEPNGQNNPNGDQRWLKVHRPVIMTGGELTMRMLDLDFNSISKYYEAPLQMKANNGLLIIDDFGRQQMDPHQLLNRWIVPLDRRIDFMTMHTGMKFTIPFDMLMVFATNIEPKDLADEAFLRRMRYKIKIDHPKRQDFMKIFKDVCSDRDMSFNQEAFDLLDAEFYRSQDVPYCAAHPKDLMDHVVNFSRYFNRPPEMNAETIRYAYENYFVMNP